MSLKEKIFNAGFKQKFIAEKIGITPEHLNQMLNGKISMSEDIRNKINELLSKVSL